ncbi:hypothetical protein BC008_19905 [Mastigocoleus testarum BC008]|uniref:Uncharacterized protein n=2 Tax=Mastigocoleus TaxID=996924 RepID=A0A0V7ZKC7_9CYAN|nr:hypothetical protein BC008_19905 [Mastigocoleus testarum BC008]
MVLTFADSEIFFFTHLQRKSYMNLNNNQKNSGNEPRKALVRVSQSLQLTDLLDLLESKYLALRIPNYYPQQEAEEISQELIKQKTLERYDRAPDVGVQRTAITFFETSCCVEMLQRYYKHAQVSIQTLRQACFPNLSPLDKLKLELEEMWVAGAHIENIHDKTMLAGIGRVFEDNFELPPHQDIFARDISDSGVPPTRPFENLTAQLSANIYLQIPESGGELEVWELKPSTFKQEEIRDQDYKYEGIIDRNILPKPTLLIKPEKGELILFDSGRVHAVRSCQGGPRVSMSIFIGYRTQDKSLTYWS